MYLQVFFPAGQTNIVYNNKFCINSQSSTLQQIISIDEETMNFWKYCECASTHLFKYASLKYIQVFN